MAFAAFFSDYIFKEHCRQLSPVSLIYSFRRQLSRRVGQTITLSGKSIIVMLRFLQKRQWTGKGKKTTYTNTNLVFTYEEAEELGISRSTFLEILTKLVELGFIDIEHQGNGLAKDYSRYAVSERWKYYGTPYFKHVTKQKVCRAGHDVHSRKLALKQVTENRNCQLRKTVTIDDLGSQHVSGNP